jgi:chromosome segregation ATPase
MKPMPVAKTQSWSHLLLGGGDPMDQIGVLDANLGHVQRDVSEIKSDQRRAGDKLDDMNGRLDSLRDKIDEVGGDANKRIDAVADKVTGARTDITTQLENVRKEISTEVNVVRADLSQLRGELYVVQTSVAAAKVWTLSLQLTIAAGLLAVMAHGFKWL